MAAAAVAWPARRPRFGRPPATSPTPWSTCSCRVRLRVTHVTAPAYPRWPATRAVAAGAVAGDDSTPAQQPPPARGRVRRLRASATSPQIPQDTPRAVEDVSRPEPPQPAQQQSQPSASLDAAQLAKLRAYVDHLLLVNQSMNLTGELYTY
jgi:hypothetical protein